MEYRLTVSPKKSFQPVKKRTLAYGNYRFLNVAIFEHNKTSFTGCFFCDTITWQ